MGALALSGSYPLLNDGQGTAVDPDDPDASAANASRFGGTDAQDRYEQQAAAPPALPPTRAIPATTVAADDTPPLSHLQQLIADRAAARAAQQARFDPKNFEAEDGAQEIGVPPPPKTSALGDFGRQAWISAMGTGQALLGAVSATTRALGADPETVAHVEDMRAAVADESARWANKLSPEAREAMHASLFGGKDEDGHDVPTPSSVGWGHYVGATLADLVPTVAMAVLPAGLVGRVTTKLATMAGDVALKAAASGTVAGTATTAGLFGAVSAGQSYEAFTAAIDKASDAELMKNPAYKDMRDKGMSVEDAKKNLVGIITPSFVAAHAMAGAAGGVGVGGLLGKGAVGAAGRGALGRLGIGAAEGAATMGGQAGAEDALDQAAQMKAGTQDQFDAGRTTKALASGALGGLVLGGGGALLHGGGDLAHRPDLGAKPDAPAATPENPVPPAEGQAMHLALGGPEAPLQLGYDPTGEKTPYLPKQGDGFTMAEGTPEAPAPTPAISPASAEASASEPSQEPTSAPPPAATPQGQGEMFPAPAEAPPTVTAPAGDTAPPAPAPVPATAAKLTQAEKLGAFKAAVSDPDAPQPPPNSLSRPTMLKALKAGGIDGKEVVAAKGSDLHDRLVQMIRDQAGAQPDAAPESPAGRANGEAVSLETSPVLGETPAAPSEAPPASPALAASKAVLQARIDKLRAEKEGGAPPAAAEVLPNPAEVKPPTVEVKPSKAVISTEAPAPEAPAKPKSARQLRKEQMAAPAAPVERAKGYVANDVAEAPPPVPGTPAREPRSHAEAVTDMRDAFDQAKALIKPIQKGQVGPALTKAMREITDLIKGKPEGEASVHQAVAEWGKSSTEPLPMSTTRRRPIANKMLELLTGKGYDSEMASRAAIRELMAEDRGRSGGGGGPDGRQREAQTARGEDAIDDREAVKMQRAEVDAEGKEVAHQADEAMPADASQVTRGVIEDAAQEVERARTAAEAATAEEPSQGVTNYDAHEKARAAGSNTERVAGDLLSKVLDGQMTIHEAQAALGTKAAGTRGRTRKVADMGAAIDEAIKRAEDPEVLARLKTALINSTDSDGVGSKLLRKAITETGPEHVTRLRALKAELTDPVGVAVHGTPAATAARKSPSTRNSQSESAGFAVPKGLARVRKDVQANMHAAHADGIAPTASRYVEAAADPRVNADVQRAMLATEKHGITYTTRDFLHTVVHSSAIKAELRPLRELAQRLLKLAPDIPMMTVEHAREYDHYHAGMDRALGATYRRDGQPLHVVMRADMGGHASQHVEVGLHEIVHSITAERLDREIKVGGRDARVLEAIKAELLAQAPDQHAIGEMGLDQFAVRDATKDLHELHSMILTNPSLQALMARLPASEGFRAQMRELGYEAREPGKSVWRYFTDWVRRTLGLDPARSASEQALLDHVLRPAQDILDHGAAYNRMVRDPVVRGMGEPLLRSVGGSLGGGVREATDRAIRAVDPAGLGDKLKRGLLQGANTGAIHDWNRALFEPSDRLAIGSNPLTRFVAAQEKIAHATKLAHEKDADRAGALVDYLKNGRDGAELGRLMNDATLAGVRLGDNRDNSHLATPAEQAELRTLQARYDALSPEGRATYDGARKLHEGWTEAERQARLEAVTKLVLPDATPAQRSAVSDALRSKKATDAFLASMDGSRLAQEFGAQWQTSRPLVKEVARMNSMGFVRGDYFPLRRNGDYMVRYGRGEKTGVEMFERRGDAEARRAELATQDMDDLSQVYSKRDSGLKEVLPDHSVVGALEDAMRRDPRLSGQADAVRDLVQQTLLQYATHAQAARTAMRRKGVLGATTDAGRTLAQEWHAHGTRMGHLLHDGERNQAMRHMELVEDDLRRSGGPGQSITAKAVIRELQARMASPDDATNALSGLTRRASTLGYVQSLMSFSHIATGTIETHMNSTSLLGARHGAVKAGFALSKALADVTPKLFGRGVGNTLTAAKAFAGMGRDLKAADWNLAHVARDRFIARGADARSMTDLFDRLDRAGLIDHSMTREMQRIANPGFATTGAGKAWQRFMDLNAAGAHAADVANKSAVVKAAYDLERRRGATHDQAAEYAVGTLRKVAPNYNLSNKSRISTASGFLGGFAAPVMQFKQYGIHMYGMMANLTRDSVRGATPEARSEARKALAGILATHAVMAGGLTLIADPLRYLGGAWDFATGAERPHDYQNDVRNWLADTFGPELGELLARGAPHAAGIDIHRRVGLGNLLEVPELESYDGKGVFKMLATAMTGASGQDAAAMVGGMSKMARGLQHGDANQLLSGTQDLVPRVVRDVMKAAKLADKGVADTRGQVGLPASRISPYNVAAQALGFQPSMVSEYREGRAAVQEAQMEAKTERTRLTQAWVEAQPADRAAVMSEIRQFNQAHPGLTLTFDQLIQAKQARIKGEAGGGATSFGLRLPPKAAAALAASGRFSAANLKGFGDRAS